MEGDLRKLHVCDPNIDVTQVTVNMLESLTQTHPEGEAEIVVHALEEGRVVDRAEVVFQGGRYILNWISKEDFKQREISSYLARSGYVRLSLGVKGKGDREYHLVHEEKGVVLYIPNAVN